MLSCLGPVLRGGANVTGDQEAVLFVYYKTMTVCSGWSSGDGENWMFSRNILVKKSQSSGGGWERCCSSFPCWATNHPKLSNSTTLMYYLTVSMVRSPGAEGWVLCPGPYQMSVRCWLGLWSHQRISWEKTHFQTPSGAWQNSSPCNL